tara:strand:- start:335 stop:526 length:192 start_codon:yes stop_codon:yes gene_type:complete
MERLTFKEAALIRIEAHEKECVVRYEYIEKRLDEGAQRFKRLEAIIWGVYPFIVGSIILSKFI